MMMKVAVLALCCLAASADQFPDCKDTKGARCIAGLQSPDPSKPYKFPRCFADEKLQDSEFFKHYCPDFKICCPKSASTSDDPWVEGLAGQHFFFKPKTPEAAWYAAISDPNLQVNLKLHSYDGVSEVDPDRDFYTGATIQVFDNAGATVQSLHVEVRDDEKFDFHCLDLDDSAPDHCLGGGAIDVFVNGVRMLEPGHVHIGDSVDLTGANVIASCQAVGDIQLRHQPQLQKNRHLMAFDFEDFLLNRSIRNPEDCERWITSTKRSKGDLFKNAGTKSTIYLSTPRLNSVIDFDTHIPTDVSVMPLTYRIGYFLETYSAPAEGSEGFIGETSTVRFDQSGQPIMTGKVLKAADTMYRVDGPFGRDFEAKHM